MLSKKVTKIPLATVADAKLALCVKLTLAPSVPTKPTNEPPMTVAFVPPS